MEAKYGIFQMVLVCLRADYGATRLLELDFNRLRK
jgi:hypothetical protein